MKKGFLYFVRERKGVFLLLYLFIAFLYPSGDVQSNQTTDLLIQLLTPSEDEVTIAKKPFIQCSIKPLFDSQKLLVLLDGTDISALLSITSGGFEFRPPGNLAPGSHTLNVTSYTPEGKEFGREFKFSTRHSKPFEEISSNNQITILYEKSMGKSKEASNIPSYKEESNLESDSKLKEKGWELTFKTNVRHFDQNLQPPSPLENGFSLANYLVQGKYTDNRFNFLGETGDVVINETSNTVQGLARRGGNFVFQSKDLHLQLRTFAVKSEQVFGFNGGMGIGGTTDDHILGVSGDVGLLSDKVRFRTIYVTGGEEGNSLGVSTTGGAKKGNVLGFLLTTDFFKQKLTTEAELDISKFDADTRDEFSSDGDKAYKLKAGGISGNYTYEALYEYMGPDYEVIGNPCLQKNREGFTLKTGANYQIQTMNLSFSRYHDNVNKDDLFPRVYTTQGTIDYTFLKIKNLPIGLSYQRSMQDSSNEPDLTFPIKMSTDMISGRIEYLKGGWHFTFQPSYSLQNDRTSTDNDTSTITLTFIPHYGITRLFGKENNLSITPTLSYNRANSQVTRVHTDTYTTNLDLQGDLFEKRVTYGFGGTYNKVKASDGSSKQDTLNTTFNASYLFGEKIWGFLKPSVGMRGLYNWTNDRVLGQTKNELAFFLVIQAKMAFLF